jgi:uncharacterized membrane protein YfcA
MHARNRCVSRPLVLWMGVASALAAGVGAWWSSHVAGHTLMIIFAGIASLACILMLLPRSAPDDEVDDPDAVPFHRGLAVLLALGVGVLGGLVGASGAFIYVPLLLHVLKIPLRVTLGSTLLIVLFSSLTGMVGKLATGQVPLLPALTLVLGAVPGAQLGGWLSKRTPVRVLGC